MLRLYMIGKPVLYRIVSSPRDWEIRASRSKNINWKVKTVIEDVSTYLEFVSKKEHLAVDVFGFVFCKKKWITVLFTLKHIKIARHFYRIANSSRTAFSLPCLVKVLGKSMDVSWWFKLFEDWNLTEIISNSRSNWPKNLTKIARLILSEDEIITLQNHCEKIMLFWHAWYQRFARNQRMKHDLYPAQLRFEKCQPETI